ncbi:MAG: DUF1186 family protein [Rhodospirillales bacterium]|nr:DUF1186 family protein [Rhodospirillales bacterium]
MQPSDILHAFTSADDLPYEAIKVAEAQQEEMLPHFLKAVEEYVATADQVEESAATPIFFVLHMLGSWRAREAYRPLAKLLASNAMRLEAALGEALTLTINRVMLGLFDGDPQPLMEVVATASAHPYARGAMLNTLALATRHGLWSRDEAAVYLRRCYEDILPRGQHYAWVEWQAAVALLGLETLKAQVEQVFAAGWADEVFVTAEEFAEELALGVKGSGRAPEASELDRQPFGDLLTEFATWEFSAGFADDDAEEGEGSDEDPL